MERLAGEDAVFRMHFYNRDGGRVNLCLNGARCCARRAVDLGWVRGRFRFLTGDDKSSWYYLRKSGWEMPYIPDVTILTVEHPPHPNFLAGATMLMIRWFGNMLRTNARAIAIPRSRIGTFVWWCLVDQRVSMWTSLIGLVAAVMGSILYGIEMLWLYAVWIMLTRFVLTVGLTSARPNVSMAVTWAMILTIST